MCTAVLASVCMCWNLQQSHPSSSSDADSPAPAAAAPPV